MAKIIWAENYDGKNDFVNKQYSKNSADGKKRENRFSDASLKAQSRCIAVHYSYEYRNDFYL